MKKIAGSLSVILLFFMFSCGSGPEAADEQDAQVDVEVFEQEREGVKMEAEKKATDDDKQLIEREAGAAKIKAEDEKMIERKPAEPQKEEPELQLKKIE